MPEVASVSALDPASIQIPTVAVCKYGEYSVATESPFDKVVVCVGLIIEFAGVARLRRIRGALEREFRRRDFAVEGMRIRETVIMMEL